MALPRSRGLLLFGGTGLVLACLAFVLVRPLVEERARARLQRAASRLGLQATFDGIRLRPWLSLELQGVALANASHGLELTTPEIVLRPRLSLLGLIGRAVRIETAPAVVLLPKGLQLELGASACSVDAGRRGLDVTGSSRTDRVLLRGRPLAELGALDFQLRTETGEEVVRLSLRALARGLVLESSATNGDANGGDESPGAGGDVELEVDASLRPRPGSLEAERIRLLSAGVEAKGRLSVEGGTTDPRIDVELDVAQADVGRLLAPAGLGLASDLGSASLEAQVRGRLLDPASLVVNDRLRFTPPRRIPPEIARLKGPFRQRVRGTDGRLHEILVSPDAPDFLPLAEVPPLFVRALLIGEDAGFFGHAGVDLKELPAALAEDLKRGAFVRGASTISQQLAKNLFLSRKRTLARKLEEIALALLLDSTLGKTRVLEIYLNVIEWGPGIFGLRPAARHYFGKEPADLTPRQIAFLVCLIPGPIKYQRSFASGELSPFFEGQVAGLLGKLESVGALSEAEHEAALAEPLGLAIARTEPTSPAEEGSP